jgi:hypothetical protein
MPPYGHRAVDVEEVAGGGDQPTMPRQDRGGRDQLVCPQHLWQAPDQRGEQGSIGPVQRRSRVAPAEDRVLVTQDKDLNLPTRASPSEPGQPAEGKVQQAQRHTPDSAWHRTGAAQPPRSTTVTEFQNPTGASVMDGVGECLADCRNEVADAVGV